MLDLEGVKERKKNLNLGKANYGKQWSKYWCSPIDIAIKYHNMQCSPRCNEMTHLITVTEILISSMTSTRVACDKT